jgi:hypothetical protein
VKRKRDDTRAAATAAKSAKATPSGEVKVKIQRFGPSPEQLQALAPRLNAHPAIKKALTKT